MDLFEYETDMGTGDTGADSSTAGSGDAAAGADTSTFDGGAAPDSNDAAPAPAPAFNPDQFRQELAGELDQRLAPLVQALTPQPEAPSFDQLDPFSDTYQQDLAALIRHEAQQLISPYQQVMEQAQQQQVSQWVDHNLDQAMQTYKAPDGTEGDRQAVLYAAAGFRAVTGDDAKAITAARDYMAQHDQQIASKAVEQYKQSISNDNGTQRDPAVNGAAVGIEPAPKSYADILNRWETRTAA